MHSDALAEHGELPGVSPGVKRSVAVDAEYPGGGATVSRFGVETVFETTLSVKPPAVCVAVKFGIAAPTTMF